MRVPIQNSWLYALNSVTILASSEILPPSFESTTDAGVVMKYAPYIYKGNDVLRPCDLEMANGVGAATI
jgi:hypothetical protein